MNSEGKQDLMKKLIEFLLQQAMDKNAKKNNEPVPKQFLTNKLVEYYKVLIKSQQLQKQYAELKIHYKRIIDIVKRKIQGNIRPNQQSKFKCNRRKF